ncbi:MAG: SDR family NAD(P)-dependent oxidoreductase, partial [Gloeomargaritales cyanobacterium]
TLDINFRGTVDLTEELLPLVRKSTDGRIVNVASMTGRLSQISSSELRSKLTSPSLTMTELRKLLDDFESDVENGIHTENGWSNSNYGMSKLALIAATKIMAKDESLARSCVKVNACCPGYCATDMTSHKGNQSASNGARTPVLLATMDLKDCATGEFYKNMVKSDW